MRRLALVIYKRMKFKKWYATWMNIIKIKKAEKEEEA